MGFGCMLREPDYKLFIIKHFPCSTQSLPFCGPSRHYALRLESIHTIILILPAAYWSNSLSASGYRQNDECKKSVEAISIHYSPI